MSRFKDGAGEETVRKDRERGDRFAADWDESAVCQVCFHHCLLRPGQTGLCRARENQGGKVICNNYGRLTSMALAPIEKKPLAMYRPGSHVLSVGSYGCNLRCPFCQNHEISMAGGEEAKSVYVSPEELARRAFSLREKGNIGVAFTYNEPLVGFEYVRDTASLIRQLGMKNVVVTNGSVTREAQEEILPFVDAMNIDLKGFTESYYQKLGGDLETVKYFIERAADSCHVELTTLIVPGENDTREEMERLSSWVAGVNPDIPLHVTRFFPRWKMTASRPADVGQVYRLAEIAGQSLRHVFVGNC